jgi:hypothetical protein
MLVTVVYIFVLPLIAAGNKLFQLRELSAEIVALGLDCDIPSDPLGPLDGLLVETYIDLTMDASEEDAAEYRDRLETAARTFCKSTIEEIFKRVIERAIAESPSLTFLHEDGRRFGSLMARIEQYEPGLNARTGTPLEEAEYKQMIIQHMFIDIARAKPAFVPDALKVINQFLDEFEQNGVPDSEIFRACYIAYRNHLNFVFAMQNVLGHY